MGSNGLTQRAVDALRPPATGYQCLWDNLVTGFGARITAKGALSFVLRYVLDGRQRLITLGRYPVMSLDTARQRAIQYRAKMVLSSEDPFVDRYKDIPTLNEYSQTYLNGYAKANKRPHSIIDDECGLRLYILPTLGHMRLNTVHKRDVAALHYSLADKPYRANRALALLSKIFNLAIDDGYRVDNPVKGVKHYNEEPRTRWLSIDETSRLAVVLKADEHRVGGLAILFLLATGARKGEALNATWNQFRLDQKLWIKPASCTKQKKEHVVELNDYAMSLLAELKKDNPSPYVFYYSRLQSRLKDLATFWQRIRLKAELPNVRIHDLRHTFASQIINQGFSLEVVGELLGHSNLSTTRRYAHVLSSTRKAATDIVGKILQETVQSTVPSPQSQ